MTQREKSLFRVFAIVAAVLVPGAILYLLVVDPYLSYGREISALEEEVQANHQLIAQRLKDKQQMERWRLLSLPGAPGKDGKTDVATAEHTYLNFLRPLLRECDFREVVTQQPSQSKSAPTPGKKAPPHTFLPFTVTGKADLASVIKFLEKMDKAPFVHRVTSLTLDSKEGTPKGFELLTVKITIEAVIVARSQTYVELRGRMLALDALAGLQRGPVGMSMVLWAVSPAGPLQAPPAVRGRHYGDILARNFFTGGKAVKEPTIVVAKPIDPKSVLPWTWPFVKVEGPDMRKYYTLVQINHTNIPNPKVKENEAHLNNDQMTNPKERYLTLRENDQFKYLRGKDARVLRIAHREFYFQDVATKNVYAMGMRETIGDAIARALTRDEIKKLGLDGKKQSARRD